MSHYRADDVRELLTAFRDEYWCLSEVQDRQDELRFSDRVVAAAFDEALIALADLDTVEVGDE